MPGTFVRLGFRQTAYLSLATLPAWFPQDSLPSIYRVTVVSQGWLCAASYHQAWFGKAEVSTFPSFADKVRARGKHTHPPPVTSALHSAERGLPEPSLSILILLEDSCSIRSDSHSFLQLFWLPHRKTSFFIPHSFINYNNSFERSASIQSTHNTSNCLGCTDN